MDVRTGPPFGVGVAGVEAAEACRPVFILDILFYRRNALPHFPYLPQTEKQPVVQEHTDIGQLWKELGHGFLAGRRCLGRLVLFDHDLKRVN
jgi:hypothetical protein